MIRPVPRSALVASAAAGTGSAAGACPASANIAAAAGAHGRRGTVRTRGRNSGVAGSARSDVVATVRIVVGCGGVCVGAGRPTPATTATAIRIRVDSVHHLTGDPEAEP